MSDTVHIVKCNVLNAVQSQEIITLKDRIKRLEEAGDYLNKCLLSVMGENHPAKLAWNKANEAKP